MKKNLPDTPFRIAYYMLKELGICVVCHRKWISEESTTKCKRCLKYHRLYDREWNRRKARQLKNASR